MDFNFETKKLTIEALIKQIVVKKEYFQKNDEFGIVYKLLYINF